MITWLFEIMKIILHSSKTMKPVEFDHAQLTQPQFIDQAKQLHQELAKLNVAEIGQLMKVSDKLAGQIQEQIASWQPITGLSPAALTFRGDIYSGLRAQAWDDVARRYATQHLWILSGLYGVLRPFDAVAPYRLEMGYPLQVAGLSLYEYWNQALARLVSAEDVYINVTAEEYLRSIKKSLTDATMITPKFLTVSPKTGQPVFVTVHAKVARGAFANWLITNQVTDLALLRNFDDLGYRYDEKLSTINAPVFVCKQFTGLGLSVRLR